MKKRRKPNPERGLITRVAKLLNKSVSLVSMVNAGIAKSGKVELALAGERRKLRQAREAS